MSVAIVGASVAGLVAALRLKQAHPELDVEVLDASAVPGGRFGSVVEPGSYRGVERGLHLIRGDFYHLFEALEGAYQIVGNHPELRMRTLEEALAPLSSIRLSDRSGGTFGDWRFRWSVANRIRTDVRVADVARPSRTEQRVAMLDRALFAASAELQGVGRERPRGRAGTSSLEAAVQRARGEHAKLSDALRPGGLGPGYTLDFEAVSWEDTVRGITEALDQALAAPATSRVEGRVQRLLRLARLLLRPQEVVEASFRGVGLQEVLLNGGFLPSELDCPLVGFVYGLLDACGAKELGRDVDAAVAVDALNSFFGSSSGSLMYKAQAGTGESLILPIYLACRHLGVRFHPGHTLVDLRQGDDGVRLVFERNAGLHRAELGAQGPDGGLAWLHDDAPSSGAPSTSVGAPTRVERLLRGTASPNQARRERSRRERSHDEIVLACGWGEIVSLAPHVPSAGAFFQWVREAAPVYRVVVQLELNRSLRRLGWSASEECPVLFGLPLPYLNALDVSGSGVASSTLLLSACVTSAVGICPAELPLEQVLAESAVSVGASARETFDSWLDAHGEVLLGTEGRSPGWDSDLVAYVSVPRLDEGEDAVAEGAAPSRPAPATDVSRPYSVVPPWTGTTGFDATDGIWGVAGLGAASGTLTRYQGEDSIESEVVAGLRQADRILERLAHRTDPPRRARDR